MKKQIHITKEAVQTYQEFKHREENSPDFDGKEIMIGKPTTIQKIINICQEINPKRVLEMGAGTGTISYTVLKYSNAHLDTYEHYDFCQKHLINNLKEFEDRYTLIKDYRLLPPHTDYDLVIIDGGSGKPWDGGFSKAVWIYLSCINNVKYVHVEGYRHYQRYLARKALSQRQIYKLIDYSEYQLDEQKLSGGLTIKCKPCKFRILRFFNWLFWELKTGKIIEMKINYLLKKLKNRHVK
ncbi:hypothetical protein A3B87_00175 [Candidatus Kuenenbacteria bacterium RIFCSPHIGHO2_02_FULL_39_13]|uniref:Methyltransferase small domain-containing protein n=1 Tax=Candidatus Kuenenbacteria bacterium RIFCSPHIGHO2_02_FULL_39_13 TaxID=1798561 RepID=A0A1F6FN37_9BACT|nr:MAG: hypothetical protein A3B87_00175 [Candidatus Kuenenbacteria bacterium RIFCSPHIGHO2_02_FULL_39_13]